MLAGLNGALPTGGDGARHHRIQARSTGHAGFERLHVQVADHDGSLVPDFAFLVPDVAREFDTPGGLLIVPRMEFAGEVDASQQKVTAPWQFQMPHRHPIRVPNRSHEFTRKPYKYVDTVAGIDVRPGVMIWPLHRRRVEFRRNHGRCQRTCFR